MRELFVSLGLQAFGYTMVQIFLPIYLLRGGMSLQEIALLFIISSALQMAIHGLIQHTINFIGVKHALTLSYIFSIAGFAFIGLSQHEWSMLVSGLMLIACGNAFYWDSRHTQSASVIPRKSTGKTVGLTFVLVLMAAALGPLIGGLIGERYGLAITMLFAAVVILLAVFPLFATPDDNFRISRKRSRQRLPRKHLIANFALNFEVGISEMLWPLFVYLLIGSLTTIGFLFSAGMIATILITLIVGPMTDNGFGRFFVRGASLGRAVVHGLRITVSTLTGAFMVNLAGDIVASFKATPYAAVFYQSAQKYGIQRYIKDMEIVASFGYVAFWSILYGLLFFVSPTVALPILFTLGVLVSPLQMLIVSRR